MSKYVIPEDNLSLYAAEALSTPFPNKNSVPRLAMYKSALGHSVSPANEPDSPLIDSTYSKSLIISSDNYKSKGKVKLLGKIDKVINDINTESTYIYYDYKLDKVDIEIIPKYEKYYRFGYEMHSELENLEIDEESKGPIFTKYLYNTDPKTGTMSYGRNLNLIYSCSRDVGEDAIILTKKAAKKMSINYMDEIEVIYSPNEAVLKDLYGFRDENGKRHYRPFPLPGEFITKEVAICVAQLGNNFLSTSNSVEDADNAKYVHKGAKVIDLEVYANNKLENTFLEELRLIQYNYIREISYFLGKLQMDPYYGTRFSDALIYRTNRYQSIIKNDLRAGDTTLKKRTYIKIKTLNTRPLGPGDKITNRDGGKGTVCLVIPEDILAEDGTKIDGIINMSGVINRENPAQLFEKEINSLNCFLQKYLNTTKDNEDTKYNNILKWINLAHGFELEKEISKINKKDIVNLYSNEFIRLKYDPYDNKFGFLEFHKLRKFTSSLYPKLGPMTIRRGNEVFSEKHIYGKSFYMVLENGPIKDTSIRSDGIVSIKGALAKKGVSRKNHQTKWGTTASKISDLGLSILVNYFKPSDRNLLQNNTNILNDYTEGLGFKFVLEKKGVKDESSSS